MLSLKCASVLQKLEVVCCCISTLLLWQGVEVKISFDDVAERQSGVVSHYLDNRWVLKCEFVCCCMSTLLMWRGVRVKYNFEPVSTIRIPGGLRTDLCTTKTPLGASQKRQCAKRLSVCSSLILANRRPDGLLGYLKRRLQNLFESLRKKDCPLRGRNKWTPRDFSGHHECSISEIEAPAHPCSQQSTPGKGIMPLSFLCFTRTPAGWWLNKASTQFCDLWSIELQTR